jgi:hypothetical protein
VRKTAVAEKIRSELSDAKVDVPLAATIKKWLEADADFNNWFLETTKRALDDSSLLALVEGYGGDQDDVESAWEEYLDPGERGGDPDALTSVLEMSINRMAALKDK